MKKYILFAACLLPLMVVAQKEFKISGKIGTRHKPTMVYFTRFEPGDKTIEDSTKVLDGIFSFKGTVPEPESAVLDVAYEGDQGKRLKDHLFFYVANERININSADSIRQANISGSAINEENETLNVSLKPLIQRSSRIMKELSIASQIDPESKKQQWYQLKADTIDKDRLKIQEIRLKYIQTHPNSYFSLLTFQSFFIGSGQFDSKKVQKQLDGFSAGLKTTELGENIEKTIVIVSKRQIGGSPVDFTQADINKKSFTLSSLRGKYVLLDFWASWCVPCREENPNVVKAYHDLKGKNFEIVSVSLDQNQQAWENAVKKDDLPWIQVSDLKGWNNDVANQFFIKAVPQNFLINPNGVIIAVNLRGEDLIEQISAFIK